MKKESIYLILAFFILCAHSLYANKSVRLSSPNGKIKFSLVLDKNSPVYDRPQKGRGLVCRYDQ